MNVAIFTILLMVYYCILNFVLIIIIGEKGISLKSFISLSFHTKLFSQKKYDHFLNNALKMQVSFLL